MWLALYDSDMPQGTEPLRKPPQFIPIEVAIELEDASQTKELAGEVRGQAIVQGNLTVTGVSARIPADAVKVTGTTPTPGVEVEKEITEVLLITDEVIAVITDEQGNSRRVGIPLTHTTDAILTDGTRTGLNPQLEDLITEKVQEEVRKQTGRLLGKDAILLAVSLAIGVGIDNLDLVIAAGEHVVRLIVNIVIPGYYPSG